MNTKSIFSWGIFVLIIGLITWGMIAASQKAKRESANVASVDKISLSDWSRGNASSTVTLIEYSDFQCPACGAYYPIVEKLFTENKDKFTFVYRHFPLQRHPNAIPASRVAEAAGKQGKFWEMYSMIFSNQEKWVDSKNVMTIFTSYAEKLSLDMDKFKKDVDSKDLIDKIDNDLKSGLKAGVEGTPTFFLNGKKIKSPQNYEEFKKLIDDTFTATKNS